jgi:acyl-CoA thioesterase-2
MDLLEQLVSLLGLEKLEEDLFRGQSQDLGWGRVYGGQVLGQALSAASQTVEGARAVHSMHAYFLRPGDVNKPILYTVDRSRDGGSFSSRRVAAIQSGRPILTLAASFQMPEVGMDHQDPAPEAASPELVAPDSERYQRYAARLPKGFAEGFAAVWPFDFRPTMLEDDPFTPTPQKPEKMVWLRAQGKLPDNPALHAWLLAYASDFGLLSACLLPHGITWLHREMQIASIDHAMWFHRPLRIDDWLLHVMDSPSASSGRGLARGRVFTREGVLVASTAQEGLIRRRRAPGGSKKP